MSYIVGVIAAVGAGNIIGVNGAIPWHHPSDLAHFKEVTLDTTVVMGRLTWESIGKKPLPRRTNIVVTSRPDLVGEGAEAVSRVEEVLDRDRTIWFIGGEDIYRAAAPYCNVMYITFVPDSVTVHINDRVSRFPWDAFSSYEWISSSKLRKTKELERVVFLRK